MFYNHKGYVSSPCKKCFLAREKDRLYSNPVRLANHRAYKSQWQKDNLPRIQKRISAHAAKRRALKAGAKRNDLTEKQWEEILVVHGHRCAYCLKRFDKLEKDHVIALTRGGDHTADNIVPACRSCNSKKNNRPLWTMLG